MKYLYIKKREKIRTNDKREIVIKKDIYEVIL